MMDLYSAWLTTLSLSTSPSLLVRLFWWTLDTTSMSTSGLGKASTEKTWPQSATKSKKQSYPPLKKYFLFSLSPGSKQPLPSSVLARKSLSYTLQLRHSSTPSGSSSAPSQNRVRDQPATTTCCGSMHQPPRQRNRLFQRYSILK